MTAVTRKYPSKVLLFGEYAVLRGSEALSVPFPQYGGYWHYRKGETDPRLRDFNAYLSKQLPELDTKAFGNALQKGLFFQSDIPQGYGMGSSGALCAAVYDAFGPAEKPDSTAGIREVFVRMESYFHGRSSGFDPLVSYLGQPIRQSARGLEVVKDWRFPKGLFLLDTGMPRQARDFVGIFEANCEKPDFLRLLKTRLLPQNALAISACQSSDRAALASAFAEISAFQWRHFQAMIPDAFRDIWAEGLSGNAFRLKLCGAGGGGFLLGYQLDPQAAAERLSPFKWMPLAAEG